MMDLLIGTDKGVFVADAHGRVKAAAGAEQRSVRHLSRVNGDLLAGTDGGVVRSSDGGYSWTSSGIAGYFVWDVAAVPGAPHTLYAVTEPAALFRSEDGGRSWVELPSFRAAPGAEEWCLPRTTIAGRARTIVVDRTQPAHLLVGIEVGGVYESRDAGATWRFVRPGGNPDIHVIVHHPQRANLMFTSTGFGRPVGTAEPMEQRIAGVFASDDGGASWRFMWQGMRPPYTRPLCIDPRPPFALTVASAPIAFSSIKDEGGAQAVIYQRDDGREPWRSLGDATHSPSPANFHAVTPDPERASGVLVGTETGEVWRVSPEAKWTLLVAELPMVQAILPLN
jgi:photosystem II stability/assembly factor-like uncharacterized protein